MPGWGLATVLATRADEQRWGRMEQLQKMALIIHILAAVGLVGAVGFHAFVLMPTLSRVPPAHAAALSDEVGARVKWGGGALLALLGVTGFMRLDRIGLLTDLFTVDFYSTVYGWRLGLMFWSWLLLVVTGSASVVWYERAVARARQTGGTLHELGSRRARQQRMTRRRDWLNWANVSLAASAALGGALWRTM